MSETSYFQIDITAVPRTQEDWVTYLLFEMGAAGVQENLQFIQRDRFFSPEVIESDRLDLIAYFEQPPSPEDVQALATRLPECEVKVSEQASQDWLSLWKASWKPFPLCEDVWIVPPWLAQEFAPPAQAQVLLIEPGMAFGTGTHPTTQLAARLLKDQVQSVPTASVLDVGTGSGILALLAHRLGVPDVRAYDNDPEANRVVTENCELNQVPLFQWVENWPQIPAGQIDLTVANIIDGVLVRLKSEFRALQSPYYLFTGVLEEREAIFLEEMLEDWPLRLLRREQLGEWIGYLFAGAP